MGYYDKSGNIGNYNNSPVYVCGKVEYDDLEKKGLLEKKTTYAIRGPRSSKMMTLVKDNMAFGTLNDDGHVVDMKPYPWKKKEEKRETVYTPVSVEFEKPVELKTADLFAMSAKIDEFLKEAINKKY